jgi:hypothetical protein
MNESINRIAIVVKCKQPVIDWVNKIFPEDPITDYFDGENEDKDEIFLVPLPHYGDDSEKILKRYYKDIFHFELWGWCTDEKLYPKALTWKMFNEWFDYTIQSMVIDLSDEELMKEGY